VVQVRVWFGAVPASVHPVRGQNTPDDQLCGMQKVAVVLQRPETQGAEPGQSLSVPHVHWPFPRLQVCFDPHCLLLVQAGASAQFPLSGDDGGTEGPGPFCPTKIGCWQ
jgi:hypothetical protein